MGSRPGYLHADFLYAEIARRQLERLGYVKLQPQRVLDLGCGLGRTTFDLAQRYPQAEVLGLDLSARAIEVATQQAGRWSARLKAASDTQQTSARVKFWTSFFGQRNRSQAAPPVDQSAAALKQPMHAPRFIEGDFHRLPFETASFDLLFSNLALHWSDDPLAALQECRRVLRPGGLMLFTVFGPDSFQELKALEPALQLPVWQDMHDWGDGLHRQKFAEPVMDSERISLTYSDSSRLLADLRAFGGNPLKIRFQGLRGRQFGVQVGVALRQVVQKASADGMFRLTVEVVSGQAWVTDRPFLPEGLAPVEFHPSLRRR